ncbi:class I SAM-dependent methyltransferase [Thermogutta sp.]|uniref:class I SAM-dependent methyltransferase n=1 Tax=Thermogutta sp. TaxID=1962930 RepID=UPI003C7E1062
MANGDYREALPAAVDRTDRRANWLGRLVAWLGGRGVTVGTSLERLHHHCQQWADRTTAPPTVVTLAGLATETLMEYGQREAAWRMARWLEARQLSDGSVSESRAPEAVFTVTAAALRAWLACLPELAQFEFCAQKAAQFLRQWIGGEGRILPPKTRSWNYEGDGPFRETPDLTPLLRAGRRWPDTDWTTAALRAIDYWLTHGHRHNQPETTGALVRRAFLYLEWSRRQDALALVEKVDRLQLASGALPEREGQRVVHLSTVAQASIVWFRLYNQTRGENAMRFMQRHLTPQGSLPTTVNAGTNRDQEEDPLALKYYLDATLWRVRCAAHAKLREEVPLDSSDPRLQKARTWAQGLPSGSLVADLGCGTGRYLRYLASWFPQLRWVGIDFLPEALEQVPRGIKTIEGSLLRVPVSERAFHGVLMVDTLADVLLPDQVLREVIRILRPGGRLLLIEPATKGRLCPQTPWGQALSLQAIERLLRGSCQQTSVETFAVSGGTFSSRSYAAIIAIKMPRS